MFILLIMSCFSLCVPNNPTWYNTVPYVPKISKAIVIKVYDGDTITIAHKMSIFDRKYYRFSVRLARIDCPELRTKNLVEKEYATKAKLELEKLILNKTVELKVIKTDKYGRLLAEVYFQNKSLNSWLLHIHLAVEYDGTKKMSPSNWGEYYQEIDFCSFENFNHINT